MKTPYLIQRMKESYKNSTENGIDKYFRCDYMGSSEFEFGALPKSLKRIREHIDLYKKIEFKSENILDSLYLFCKPEDKFDIEQFINKAITERHVETKERLYLQEALGISSKEYFNDIVAWWDIKNDWFLVRGKSNINNLIKGLNSK